MQNDPSHMSSLESYVSADLPIKAKKDDRLSRVDLDLATRRYKDLRKELRHEQ